MTLGAEILLFADAPTPGKHLTARSRLRQLIHTLSTWFILIEFHLVPIVGAAGRFPRAAVSRVKFSRGIKRQKLAILRMIVSYASLTYSCRQWQSPTILKGPGLNILRLITVPMQIFPTAPPASSDDARVNMVLPQLIFLILRELLTTISISRITQRIIVRSIAFIREARCGRPRRPTGL